MKRITLFIVGILCFVACNNEITPGTDPQESQQLKLVMPDAEKVNVYSTATENECVIDKIWVLEFNSTGTSLVNSELIDGSAIINNGQAIQLLPQLSFKLTNGNRIVCIANSDAKTYPHPNASSITLSNINTYFPLILNGYYFGGEHLPMYGEFTWATSQYTCELTRAVAKVQIQMGTNVSDITEDFTAENISYTIYNGSLGGYIQPPSGAIVGIPQTTPNMSTAEQYFLLQKEDATEKETNVYFYEFPSSTQTGLGAAVSNDTFHKDRQHIILTKTATSGETTYYRLDFYDPVTKKYLDIKRNHHYLFTINKVRSEGYSSLTQAQNNPGSNIEYTVRIEDGMQSITSNGQYAIATSVDTVKLTGDVTDQMVATFRYIDPTGVMTVSENSISIESGSIQPGGATLTITAPTVTTNSITGTNNELKITTTGNLTQGIILFKLGNITHRLYIKKP